MMKSITREKVFHVLKLVLLAVTVTLVLLSLLGTVAPLPGPPPDMDWSMIRSMQTTCIQSIRFPTISLISMWTIAGLGYRGTGWTALENRCSTGFTVSQILSGQSACILAMPQDMWCNRRISWTSSMTWQTVSGKVSRHLPE